MSPPEAWIRALLLATLLPLADVAAASTAPRQRRAENSMVRPVDDATRVLLAFGDSAPGQAGRHLAALGPGVLPRLFEMLEKGHFVVRIGERGNTRRTLSPSQRSALLEAFRQTPREPVLALLRALASRPDPPVTDGERAAALEVLGLHAGEADLPLALELAGPPPGARRIKQAVRGAFAGTLRAVLERTDVSTEGILSLFRKAHPSLLHGIVATLGERPDAGHLEHLARLLGELAEADALLLAAIGRVAQRLPHPLPGRTAARVRPYLWHSSPQLLVEAAIAAAHLQDREAVPHLIRLLEHADGNVATRARSSLVAISGRQVGADPQRWIDWHERELAWWQREAPARFEAIRSGAPADATRVIMELAKKHYFRHELTRPLAAGLEREETEVVALTCSALGYLGSWTAVPPLVDALGASDDEVCSAAWRALRSITGLEHGPERSLWLEVAAPWRSTR